MKNISTNSDITFYKLYHTAYFFLTEKKSASRASFIVVKKKKTNKSKFNEGVFYCASWTENFQDQTSMVGQSSYLPTTRK